MGAQGDAIALRDRESRPEGAEQMLVGAARAELLGRLSSGLVHEARNPLNAMAIHLEVLADKLRDETTGEIPAHLSRNMDAARNQVRRLDDLLRRFGEFAAGEGAGDDLAACLSRAASLSEYHLRKAGLEAGIEAVPGLRVDAPDLVCQLVLHLLLAATARAAQGATVLLVGEPCERGVRVAIRVAHSSGEDAHDDALAVDAARAIVRQLEGEIQLEVVVERWSCTIELPALQGARIAT